MTLPFLTLWPDTSPQPIPEYRFYPARRWRFDWAWPNNLHDDDDGRLDAGDQITWGGLAVEFDGGQWVAHGGRHNRDSDRAKLNMAAVMGWRVLRFSNQQWEADPLGCIAMIQQALGVTPCPT